MVRDDSDGKYTGPSTSASLDLVLDPLAQDEGLAVEVDARQRLLRPAGPTPRTADGRWVRRRGPCEPIIELSIGTSRQPSTGAPRRSASFSIAVAASVGSRPGRPAGTRCRPRSCRRAGSSKSHTSRKNRSGIWVRMPAPSPTLSSALVAPRWSRLQSDAGRAAPSGGSCGRACRRRRRRRRRRARTRGRRGPACRKRFIE